MRGEHVGVPPQLFQEQNSRGNGNPGGSTTSSQTALTTSEAGLKQPLHWLRWLTAACITVLHLKKQRGGLQRKQSRSEVTLRPAPQTASERSKQIHYRAVRRQADGEVLVLCSDLPRGYTEGLMIPIPHTAAPLPQDLTWAGWNILQNDPITFLPSD